MEFRKVFDTIPEKFDQWRPRYCDEAFQCIIGQTRLDPQKSVLEIGPGTGQATEPILKTGCDYLAVELGEHLAEYTRKKFQSYPNFHIVNADFTECDFGTKRFDLVYSAAAIQWIPEEHAFPKSYELLKSGGTLAMMLLRGDYKVPNEALYDDVEKVYAQYFHPEIPYNQRFNYENAVKYGFTGFQKLEFPGMREYNADDYVEYLGTHSDHIVLKEPDRSRFFEGVRAAILKHGNRIVFQDTIVVYLAQKP